MFRTPSWDHEIDRWDVFRVKQAWDIWLLSLSLADTKDWKFGSNSVLTHEPSNTLPGCTGSKATPYCQLDRERPLGRKETIGKKQHVTAQAPGLQGRQHSAFGEHGEGRGEESCTWPAGISRLRFLIYSLLPELPHQKQPSHITGASSSATYQCSSWDQLRRAHKHMGAFP